MNNPIHSYKLGGTIVVQKNEIISVYNSMYYRCF